MAATIAKKMVATTNHPATRSVSIEAGTGMSADYPGNCRVNPVLAAVTREEIRGSYRFALAVAATVGLFTQRA